MMRQLSEHPEAMTMGGEITKLLVASLREFDLLVVNSHEKFLFNVLLVSLVLAVLAKIYPSEARAPRD